MQHRYAIDTERRLAIIQLVGTVHSQHLVTLSKAIYADQAWLPGYSELWDGLLVTETIIELADVQAALALDHEYAERVGGGQVVGVVARQMDYIVGRLFQSMSRLNAGRAYSVFRTYPDALARLGLEEMPPVLMAWNAEL